MAAASGMPDPTRFVTGAVPRVVPDHPQLPARMGGPEARTCGAVRTASARKDQPVALARALELDVPARPEALSKMVTNYDTKLQASAPGPRA